MFLSWEDLTLEEQEQATEQYLCIRETEEQRNRTETTPEYSQPLNADMVKDCKFERINNNIQVII